jgi:hypothetical protein
LRDEAISHQCHASRSRLIGIGSVHECIYVRLAYSTSAGSHSVFVRVRVRYDSSHKTHSCTMVAACAAPHAPERLRFRAPAPPETMRSRAAQCGGGFREKVFGPPSPERSKRGGYAHMRGKTSFQESRRQLHPAVSDLPTSLIRARSASPPPKKTLRPNADIGRDGSDAHGGHARGRAHEELRDAAQILQPPSL